jgi:hypothetical protein
VLEALRWLPAESEERLPALPARLAAQGPLVQVFLPLPGALPSGAQQASLPRAVEPQPVSRAVLPEQVQQRAAEPPALLAGESP